MRDELHSQHTLIQFALICCHALTAVRAGCWSVINQRGQFTDSDDGCWINNYDLLHIDPLIKSWSETPSSSTVQQLCTLSGHVSEWDCLWPTVSLNTAWNLLKKKCMWSVYSTCLSLRLSTRPLSPLWRFCSPTVTPLGHQQHHTLINTLLLPGKHTITR